MIRGRSFEVRWTLDQLAERARESILGTGELSIRRSPLVEGGEALTAFTYGVSP